MPYAHFYENGPDGFIDEFRGKYNIPADILMEKYTENRFTYMDESIILPLFSITEGGIRFSFPYFIWYFLSS